MEFKVYEGNLLDSSASLICHQVNCHTMGSGVAKAIMDKYPKVKSEHQRFIENNKNIELLGTVQPVTVSDTQKVLNLFAQKDYGYDGQKYTSYDALDTCLKKVASYCTKNNIKSVAFPYKMSSCRGGADWNVVLALIKSAFEPTDVIVEIWKL